MPKTIKICVDKLKNLFEKECKRVQKDEKYNIDEDQIEKVVLNSAPLKRGSKNPNAKKKKRPLSGYMKFAIKNRPQIVKDNPKFAVTDVMKEIGKQWNKLNDEEKEKWNKLKEIKNKK